jgi:hypothetical protein
MPEVASEVKPYKKIIRGKNIHRKKWEFAASGIASLFFSMLTITYAGCQCENGSEKDAGVWHFSLYFAVIISDTNNVREVLTN